MLPFVVVGSFLALVLLLKYLPVRSCVLIEGIFEKTEHGSDFSDNVLIAYWFKNYCRECIERERFEQNSIYGQCYATVPKKAWNKSTFSPEKGDSVKIVEWKNIFGWTRMYKIVQTDFREVFGPKLNALSDDYYKNLGEALDKRGALEKGVSVEEYRNAEREETISYAMTKLGMSREEVISQEIDAWGYSSIRHEARRRDLSAKLGREVSYQEVLEEDRKKVREATYPGPECLLPHEIEGYAESGTLPEDRLSHLKSCIPCGVQAGMQREGWVVKNTPPGPDCLSPDELKSVEETGAMPEARLEHLSTCRGCKNHFERHKGMYIDRQAPLPPHMSAIDWL